MRKKAISGIMLTPLVLSMSTLAFNIQPVKSDWTWTETIYIRSDGSVDPDTAPISTADNITYTSLTTFMIRLSWRAITWWLTGEVTPFKEREMEEE